MARGIEPPAPEARIFEVIRGSSVDCLYHADAPEAPRLHAEASPLTMDWERHHFAVPAAFPSK
jgi:hypothetical protein